MIDDKGIVIDRVKKIGEGVISICSDEIRKDKQLMLEVVKITPFALKNIDVSVRYDFEILNECRKFLFSEKINLTLGKIEWFRECRNKLQEYDNRIKREKEILARLKENEVVPEFIKKKNNQYVRHKI